MARVAHRTSPSNMGFALLANLAAYEMRWLTLGELLDRTQAALTTLESLERYRGHFFNWYDTHNLQPLRPRYLSSVDSGNLAAAFVTLRAALSNLADDPPWPADWWQGLQDTQEVLHETAAEPPAAHEAPRPRDMDGKLEQPELLRGWLDALEQSALQVLQATPSGQQSSWLPALQRQAAAWRDELVLLGDGHHSAGLSLRERALAGNAAARSRLEEIEALCERLERLMEMDLGLLYDSSRHLLYIGYNLDERRADEGALRPAGVGGAAGRASWPSPGQLPLRALVRPRAAAGHGRRASRCCCRGAARCSST